MSPRVQPLTRNAISSSLCSPPSRFLAMRSNGVHRAATRLLRRATCRPLGALGLQNDSPPSPKLGRGSAACRRVRASSTAGVRASCRVLLWRDFGLSLPHFDAGEPLASPGRDVLPDAGAADTGESPAGAAHAGGDGRDGGAAADAGGAAGVPAGGAVDLYGDVAADGGGGLLGAAGEHGRGRGRAKRRGGDGPVGADGGRAGRLRPARRRSHPVRLDRPQHGAIIWSSSRGC